LNQQHYYRGSISYPTCPLKVFVCKYLYITNDPWYPKLTNILKQIYLKNSTHAFTNEIWNFSWLNEMIFLFYVGRNSHISQIVHSLGNIHVSHLIGLMLHKTHVLDVHDFPLSTCKWHHKTTSAIWHVFDWNHWPWDGVACFWLGCDQRNIKLYWCICH